MKNIIAFILVIATMLSLCACSSLSDNSGDVSRADYDRLVFEIEDLRDEIEKIKRNDSNILNDNQNNDSNKNNIIVGDDVSFGEYEWTVLETKNGAALIITKGIADVRWFDEEYRAYNQTWEASSLRAYLNDVFTGEFSNEEQTAIIATKIPESDNVRDHVFILSVDEVERYLTSAEKRIAVLRWSDRKVDDWARSEFHPQVDYEECVTWLSAENGYARWWWTRSVVGVSGEDYEGPIVAVVSETGDITSHDMNDDDDYGCGVRPAMWVSISALSVTH